MKRLPMWEPWFAGLVLSGLVLGTLRSSMVVTEHNVLVRFQQPDGDWVMSSDEDASLVFRPCPSDIASGIDVNGLLTKGVGYVAEHASWVELGTCKSILTDDLGFWFKDSSNNFTYRKVKEN